MSSRRLGGALSSLRYRDFRLVAVGNMVSQLGFWSQYVGVGWAARELTESNFLVTLVFAAQFFPSLLLSSVAGVMADRYDRRRLVIAGNLAMVLPPILLGVLVETDRIGIAALVALVFLGGCGQAFTQPATMAFVPSLVPPEQLHSAIALNSGLMNSTRVVGPTLGSAIINAWGVAFAFFTNALTFLGVAGACGLVRTRPPASSLARDGLVRQLRSGAAYARANRAVARLILMAAMINFFLMQGPLMPIIARDVLDGGVSTYGLLSSAPGVGFVLGAIVAAALQDGRQRRAALVVCAVGVGASLLTVGMSRSIPMTVVALGFFGLTYFTFNTIVTTMLMSAASDNYRGRVMGLYGSLTVGMIPINSLIAGGLASAVGAPLTVGTCGVVILVCTGLFLASRSLATIKSGTEEPQVAVAV